jgi:hypothetical protein
MTRPVNLKRAYNWRHRVALDLVNLWAFHTQSVPLFCSLQMPQTLELECPVKPVIPFSWPGCDELAPRVSQINWEYCSVKPEYSCEPIQWWSPSRRIINDVAQWSRIPDKSCCVIVTWTIWCWVGNCSTWQRSHHYCRMTCLCCFRHAYK